MISQFLTELDGLEELKGVVVIAATNRPDMIDPALLRPGRFDKIIEIGIPDTPTRLEILKIHTKGVPLASDVNLEDYAKKTENFTGADLASICQEAVLLAIQRNIPSVKENQVEFSNYYVTKEHFDEAMIKVKSLRKAGIIRPGDKLTAMQDQVDKLSFL